MLYKIRLTPKLRDQSPESLRASRTLYEAGLHAKGLIHRRLYLVQGELEQPDAERAAVRLLCDPVIETHEVLAGEAAEAEDERLLNVMRRTGVMDPVEQSLLRALRDLEINAWRVKSVDQYEFSHKLSPQEIKTALGALGNPVVDDAQPGALCQSELPHGKPYQFQLTHITLRNASREELDMLNRAHRLSLNDDELREIQGFFRAAGREPTDVELQTIAQTWSEHCKHKTLTGIVHYREQTAKVTGRINDDVVNDSLFEMKLVPLDGEIDNLLKATIKRATDEVKKLWCLSVFVDNAGVIEFDQDDAVCFKVETHNHPSAIEPYGGAGTGLGGVIRDILGTGLGARPVLNTNVFCFGPLDYPVDEVPRGALHPRKVMRGVVSGVRDYGNRMGIPTPNGGVHFDPRYTGNPLVYAGCVGLIPRGKVNKQAQNGDRIVVIGGRTGRDGIGGATFSSAELNSESEVVSSGAVQIGNAIAEQMVQEVLLEARDRGLFTAVTDCGAGGLSSAVGEMGERLGARVELHKVPTKYDGLSYLEVWLSEAQERMVLSVPQNKLEELLELCESQDVEASVIGAFLQTGRLELEWEGKPVCDLPMEFLHDGMPRVTREALWRSGVPRAVPQGKVSADDFNAMLVAILGSPNVCSKEWVVRQYDHEVQAGSAIKPFTGPGRDGPSDACACVPRPGGKQAIVVSNGLNTRYGDIDPFHMAMSNVDEALRNFVCTGGDIEHCAILDNFSWGNCNKPDRLGGLVRACYGCYVAARQFGTPFISGKDSLNNEFTTSAGMTVAIPPTLLISAIGRAVSLAGLTSSDLKRAGNRLYMLGLTRKEFAGSLFEQLSGRKGDDLPRVLPPDALRLYRALNAAQRERVISAAHDCAEGGLAVCLAEMAIGGRLGASVTLRQDLAARDADIADDVLLFAETNSRIVVEVDPERESRLLQLFAGLPIVLLGEVDAGQRLVIRGLDGVVCVDQPVGALTETFRKPLYAAFGEDLPATPA